mgnify:CR=1 FL=1
MKARPNFATMNECLKMRRLFQGAAETLGRERVLGVVLNRAEPDAVMGGYGYYHNYGHYYGTRQG